MTLKRYWKSLIQPRKPRPPTKLQLPMLYQAEGELLEAYAQELQLYDTPQKPPTRDGTMYATDDEYRTALVTFVRDRAQALVQQLSRVSIPHVDGVNLRKLCYAVGVQFDSSPDSYQHLASRVVTICNACCGNCGRDGNCGHTTHTIGRT